MVGPLFILQQDNGTKHTAKVIKNHLQYKEEQVLEVNLHVLESKLCKRCTEKYLTLHNLLLVVILTRTKQKLLSSCSRSAIAEIL